MVFSQDSPCGYFQDNRVSTIDYIFHELAGEDRYHLFLESGYRRQGGIFYKQSCRDCSDCIPIRIVVPGFVPGRGQKRTLRKNRDIRVEIVEHPVVTPEKATLFREYLSSKHNDRSDMNDVECSMQLEAIHYGYAGTLEMDYYLEDHLIGVGIIDLARDAVSSNYFYYDCSFLERRPGVFSIQKEIELADRLGKRYYYLGYYIEKNPKMAYKKEFGPHELLTERGWKESR